MIQGEKKSFCVNKKQFIEVLIQQSETKAIVEQASDSGTGNFDEESMKFTTASSQARSSRCSAPSARNEISVNNVLEMESTTPAMTTARNPRTCAGAAQNKILSQTASAQAESAIELTTASAQTSSPGCSASAQAESAIKLTTANAQTSPPGCSASGFEGIPRTPSRAAPSRILFQTASAQIETVPSGTKKRSRDGKKVLDSGIFTWMRGTPAKVEREKLAKNNYAMKKKTPVNSKKVQHFEDKNVLSAPRKKSNHPRHVAESLSDKSQPKIDNVYKRVPLKRPCFEFDDLKSISEQ